MENTHTSLARRLIRAVIIVTVLVLSGCAASGEARLSPSLTPKEGEPIGWLAVSVGARGVEFAPLENNVIHFEPIAASGSGRLRLYVTGTTEGYEPEIDVVLDNQYFLQTYLVPLRPGDYRVTKATMSSDNGTVSRRVESKNDPAIAFSIERDAVTYLGSYVAEVYGGENLFGMRMPAGGFFVITDEQTRDVDLLRKKGAWPNTDIRVIDAVPSRAGERSMFVRHPPGDGKGLLQPLQVIGEASGE